MALMILPVSATKNEWHTAWKDFIYRKKLLVGLIFLACVLTSFPFFFKMIENRRGTVLQDVLLAQVPALNLSIPLFTIIWLVAIFILIKCIRNPRFFLLVLHGYLLVCLSRIISLSLVSLDPPVDLVPLTDPVSNLFYGNIAVTKDLFFSGHTATLFLFFLCLRNKLEKRLVLIATLLVAAMVLVQHVHYTIDVVAAPVITYGCYLVAGISSQWKSHPVNSII